VFLNAPAKVNLHLEVRDLQPGGYHEILSVVHSVPLYDSIHIRSLKEKKALRVYCDPPLSDGPNIAAAAVRLFRAASGLESGVEIRIEKRIPIGAGLGGGSSDAAAVLAGLNRVFANPLTPGQLRELAAGLGSDVCFFLHGPAALMSGRGEKIEDLAPGEGYVFVLVYPGFPISTAAAYRWLDEDEERDRRISTPEDLKVQFEEQAPLSWKFFNSFQSTIERRYPLIRRVIGDLDEAGADLVTLSGSGSAVLGVFTDARAAGSAHKLLHRRYPGAWLLVPLQSGGVAD
jgi:4-diphosphocytidyl-2-C-methyl-D-erythritol kinase